MPKAYTPETWVDEVLTEDARYDILDDDDNPIMEDVQVDLVTSVATPGTAVNAATMQNIEDAVDAIDTLLRAVATEKTVASGVLTVDQSRHKIQPESGTADDITSISGMEADTTAIFFASDPGTDTLTFKHQANISCFGGADIALSQGMVIVYYDGTKHYIAGGGGGGGAGDMAAATYDPATIAEQLVGLTATQTLTNKRITKRVASTTDDATAVIDGDSYDEYYLTAVANATEISVTGTPTAGQTIFIGLKDAGVSKALTWTGITALGVTLPTATAAGKQHIIGIKYIASAWRAIAVGVEP